MSEKTDKMLEEIDSLTVVELSELVKGIEEKSEFDVVLTDAGSNKISVIKVVRDVTGLGLKEAKELVDGAPKTVKEAVAKAEAEEIKAKFVEAGATIELK